MSECDIADRLRAALDRDGELALGEIKTLLIEAGETIEFLRSLLEPLEEVGVERLAPKGNA
ncbi:hypothetical protein [Microvirga sp. VF16]|uniref:hypothetical protein n=1 Tax=Microvirga sp. VF16 TaxID=2807101 RepID=UPI00193DE101|nr:hypothetical protein [Microvirga sp. VF16]QRM32723.1 hypothetical protein JO965_32155 [Microvirga sp. VF16]